MKKRFLKSISLFVLSALIFANVSFPFIASAQVGGAIGAGTSGRVIGIPFGGPVVAVITECTCNIVQPSFIVNIFDKRTKVPLNLLFAPPFSVLFKEYNLVTPAVETVGTYALAGPPCRVGVEPYCTVVPSDGVIDFMPGVGTAAVPPVPLVSNLAQVLMQQIIAILIQLITATLAQNSNGGGSTGGNTLPGIASYITPTGTGAVGAPNPGATPGQGTYDPISGTPTDIAGQGGYIGGIPLIGQYNGTTANSSAYNKQGVENITKGISFGGYNWAVGKVSEFGGPNDTGVTATETGAIGGNILRQLDPNTLFMAARFDYSIISKSALKSKLYEAYNPKNGLKVTGIRVEDHGPNYYTGRAFDFSKGVLNGLGAKTDDVVYLRPIN